MLRKGKKLEELKEMLPDKRNQNGEGKQERTCKRRRMKVVKNW
jgi:hypothetical protein